MGTYPGGFKGGNAQERYLEASSTQGAFSLGSTVLRKAMAAGNRHLDGAAHHRVYEMGQERGLRATPFGKGADNATFDYRLWLVKYELSAAGQPAFAQLRLAASGTATLSSSLVRPTGSALLAASEIRADGLTVGTHDGWDKANSANGGSLAIAAHSPADNLGDAFLTVPDIFDHDGVLFEMDLTGATEANWLIERTR